MGDDERRKIWVHGVGVDVPDGVFEPHPEPRSLVRFAGPIRDEWKNALADRGVKIEFWCPPFGACLTLPPDIKPDQLGNLFPFLKGAIAYGQELCTRDLAPPTSHDQAHTGVSPQWVDVVCFGKEARARVEAQLAELGIPVLASTSSKLRVRYGGDLGLLRDLAGVKLADVARGSVLLASGSLCAALDAAGPAEEWLPGLDGSGEVIAIADTGLDVGADGERMHADFRHRVQFLTSWPINESWSDIVANPAADDGPDDRGSSHGTHVAGLALGDGAASGGRLRGIAPGARLVFQAIEQYCQIRPEARAFAASGHYLSGRPLDLRRLFAQAREQGATIHANSWGDPTAGGYNDDCYEADDFLRQNADALVLFAAGNDGADRDGDGRLEPGSLYAPASAKNVLAIGATEGPIAGRGFRGSWSAFDAAGVRFRNASDRRAPVSGAPDRIAAFSSTGPAADGRIKPDLCAPGTNLAAPRSQVSSACGWCLANPLPYYMYTGGTSCAAGVAAGVAALVRQQWRQAGGGGAPSGAALKALLICGALPVRGRAGHPVAAAHEGGFGRVSVGGSLPDRIRILNDGDGLSTGDVQEFPLHLPAGAAVRAVLCWYDVPGERLVNDLDLALLDAAGRPLVPAVPDRTNTVEVVTFMSPAGGDYRLRVTGWNVPESPQPFSLVVSNRP